MSILTIKSALGTAFLGYFAAVGITDETVINAVTDPENTNWEAIGESLGALTNRAYEDVVWFSGEPLASLKNGINKSLDGTEAGQKLAEIQNLPTDLKAKGLQMTQTYQKSSQSFVERYQENSQRFVERLQSRMSN